MLLILAIYLWILASTEVYGNQQNFDNAYINSQYGYPQPRQCNVPRPGDPDLSVNDIIWSYRFYEKEYWEQNGVYETVGTTSYQTAYHFEEYANLTIESFRAFPQGIPYEFSFESTFRLPEFSPIGKWNLFEITDYYENSQISLAMNPVYNTIEFALPNYYRQEVVFENIEIFDNSWHKVMLSFSKDNVRLWVDCVPVPNTTGGFSSTDNGRGYFDASLGQFSIAQDCQTKKSIPLDLQWMIFSCDKYKPEYTSCEELIYVNPPKNEYMNNNNFPQYETTTRKDLPPNLSFMTTTPESVSTEASLSPEQLRNQDSSVCPEQCPTGLPGPPGPPGTSANISTLPIRGPIGLPGIKGERGPIGPAGPPGPSALLTNDNRTLVLPGPKGPPGLQGLPGLPGIKGDNGLPGVSGLDGLPGMIGYKGEKGKPGMIGLKGERGLRGAPGTDGINGTPGPQGPIGNPGPPGLPGRPGKPGSSDALPNTEYSFEPQQIRDICMEIVKDYIAEIASSLVGPPGIPGVAGLPGRPGYGFPGIQGEKGMKGEHGMPGVPGLQGTQGLKGQRGQSGSPGKEGQRGVDGVGLPGIPGAPGLRGYPGMGTAGPIGKPGIAGTKGDRGDDGLPGIPGKSGQCPDCSSHLSALSYQALYQQQQRNSKGPQNNKGPQDD